ncbi:MAG TPA: DegT/DnrJ/EryC1/StrS family aminotransferase [Pyrinomonadaceae bacterium]|nr:DegT/DnrJ/EryC1/StrS family aminotransferase [Pyrinomonadaceae bacterium]
MTVPFVDLKAQYLSIKPEVDEAIRRVLDTSAFILGPAVEEFERAFAEYLGAAFCVGVSNGTAAVQLGLAACGVGAGDEVIIPANTFIATAEAVSAIGAVPVLVDCEAESSNIDAGKIEAVLTERTRAVVPVHLYGQPADLDAVFEVAARHNLIVVEDAAQAHGARYKGRRVGPLGRAGCFSFYPGKNLGAYGEGGAVVTDDPEVARRLRMLRDHGSERKYHHDIVGHNYRLEGIQGAVLSVKLRRLDAWNARRRGHAARYRELLRPLEEAGALRLPREMPYAEHVYHLFVIQTDARDELQKALASAGVQSGIHYPVPIHLQPAYQSLGHKAGDFPEAERQAASVLSLPMFAELAEEQLSRVAGATAAWAEGRRLAASI